MNEPSLLNDSYYFVFSFLITTCQLQVLFPDHLEKCSTEIILTERLPEILSSFLSLLKIYDVPH